MFSKNRLCATLGIEYPVLQGGMVWCSGWRLAAAVSQAGGLGVLGSGSMTPELLREHIAKLREATDKPFGVNVPLLYSSAEECARICIEERVPVLITSAGSPSVWTAKAHDAGLKVGHVVANVRFAQKAESAGVDFIVAEGVEAGGHDGVEELTTLVLAQMVLPHVGIPVALAGGFRDGKGLAAALALGADGIQIGSRFACTVESSAHESFKQHLLEVGRIGTMLTGRGWGPTRMVRNAFCDELLKREYSGASQQDQLAFIGTGRARRGMFEGNLEEGELEIGQIAATFTDVPTVQQVFDDIKATFQQALGRLGNAR